MNRERGVIEREVFVAASPETVFKFLTDARLMARKDRACEARSR
jgi:uncharacterized protein YndB with AHSA1/START domain